MNEHPAAADTATTHGDESSIPWLVLVYQFPKGPDSRRVKIWRRLQSIGAVAIKHSVYVLPAKEQTREDFEWLLTELQSGGADSVLLESRVVDGMTDDQIRQLFNAARCDDYQSLYQELKTAQKAIPPGQLVEGEEAHAAANSVLQRSKKRFAEIEAIDFFLAAGHDDIENEIRAFSQRLSNLRRDAKAASTAIPGGLQRNMKGLTWVTRRGVKVDRVASAWLIRRWIDWDAKFKFVNEKDYLPATTEIRFDMFDAEITHQGDKCTFEVLANMVSPDDVALQSVGELVHDIDLKDGKFARSETSGIAYLLSGIFAGLESDDERIVRASAVFDDLYRYYESTLA